MRLNKILLKISFQFVKELPLFCYVTLLFGLDLFRNIHGRMVFYDPRNTYFDLFCRFAGILLLSWLVTAFVSYVNRRWLKVLAYTIVTILFAVTFFLEYVFAMSINPNLLVLLAETTPQESHEFINTFIISGKSIIVYLGTFAIICMAIGTEWLYKRPFLHRIKNKMERSRLLACTLCGLCMLGFWQSWKNYKSLITADNTEDISKWDSFGLRSSDPIGRLFYSWRGICIMKEEQRQFEQTMRNFDKSVTTVNTDSINVVLVIGESYIKHHSQLYGYPLQTSPLLIKEKEEGRLFVFQDAVSPFNMTSASIKNMLCTNSIADHEHWSKSVFFPTLFHLAGFDVYMWDNQRDESSNAGFAFALNSFLYNDRLSSMTYTRVSNKQFQFDEGIVTSSNSIALPAKKNLIIYHLIGQHVQYNMRYPHTKQFEYFTSDSIKRKESYMDRKKRQEIAHYDNATRYNDYVLSLIIEKFKKSNTIIVYLSDHGEEVYDYRNSMGRVADGMSPNQLRYQFEIPFIIWCSNSYIERHPTIIKQMKKSLKRPFTTDLLPNLMLRLGEINTTYYHPDRDLISPEFIPRRRIVQYTFNYDSIMGGRTIRH